jgi:hypothetical protein
VIRCVVCKGDYPQTAIEIPNEPKHGVCPGCWKVQTDEMESDAIVERWMKTKGLL